MSDFTTTELEGIQNALKGADRWNANVLGKSLHGHRSYLIEDEATLRRLKAEISTLERSIQARKEVIRRLEEIASKK